MLQLFVRCQADDLSLLSEVGRRLIESPRLCDLDAELHIVTGRPGWTVFAIGVPGEGGGHATEKTVALYELGGAFPVGLDAELHWAYEHRAPSRYWSEGRSEP